MSTRKFSAKIQRFFKKTLSIFWESDIININNFLGLKIVKESFAFHDYGVFCSIIFPNKQNRNNAMKTYQISTLVIVLLLSVVTITYAAKGPCYYTKNPIQADNSDCNGGFCGGTILLDPGCMDCRGVNEEDCFPGAEGTLKLYAMKFEPCVNKYSCGIDYSQVGETGTGCAVDCM
ncbi:MAG: hypothetical protein LBL62_06790 [Planctomycetaceae bacterium]|nr:hypothetical protein [Planctomycetaceae bacterium]